MVMKIVVDILFMKSMREREGESEGILKRHKLVVVPVSSIDGPWCKCSLW